MKLVRILFISGFIFTVFNITFAQTSYGPQKPDDFDIKLLKNKTLFLPQVDKIPGVLKSDNSFKGFDTEKKIDAEFARRFDEAMKHSTFDFTTYEVLNFNIEKLKKEKDKTAIVLYFEKDFYENIYVYIAMCEPKWQIIASAPVNGMDLTQIKDLKIMMNMLAYSLIQAGHYYGSDAKPLYRDHEFRYDDNMNIFTDSLKFKTLLVPRYDKTIKNFAAFDTKMKDYLRASWTFSAYDYVDQTELNNRVADSTYPGYYMKYFDLSTANPKMPFKYWVVFSCANDDVIYEFLGQKELTPANMKYMQTQIEQWLLNFMSDKKKSQFLLQKNKPVPPPTTPQK